MNTRGRARSGIGFFKSADWPKGLFVQGQNYFCANAHGACGVNMRCVLRTGSPSGHVVVKE
jgi:hypothetical protein